MQNEIEGKQDNFAITFEWCAWRYCEVLFRYHEIIW